MKTTTRFVANGIRCAITIESPRGLESKGARAELSMTGECEGSCGQCYDGIAEAVGDDSPEVSRMLELWAGFHLAPVQPAIVAELESLAAAVNGKRFGATPDVDDAPELDADIFDSRNAIKRLEIYREAMIGLGFDPAELDTMDQGEKWPEHAAGLEDDIDAMDIVEEFLKLRDLDEAASSYSSDWQFGATLIADDYFATYAEEFASDIGAISREAQWPLQHIDWEAASEALKADYTAIQFDGRQYWVR